MKIASAQINCTVGEIQQNLAAHYQIIETAINNSIELIAFPEMSLTGYTRERGEEFTFSVDDSRLDKLKELSLNGNIIIIVGAPIRIKEDLYIGAFVIYPKQPISIYTKQYLHDGEELFYASSMHFNPIISLDKERISLAICADITNENHPFQAKQNESTIYLACIFYSENGIAFGHDQLQCYAEKYALNILMSNYSGKVWGMNSGGRSAFWNSNGELVGGLDPKDSGMLVVEKKNDKWRFKKLVTTVGGRN